MEVFWVCLYTLFIFQHFHQWFRSWFLILVLLTYWTTTELPVVSVHFRMFSSISGLYPLDIGNTHKGILCDTCGFSDICMKMVKTFDNHNVICWKEGRRGYYLLSKNYFYLQYLWYSVFKRIVYNAFLNFKKWLKFWLR